MVEVRAGTAHRAALLAPLHPLALWKHLELARLVLAGAEQARDLLDVLDRHDLLREPLRALVLPPAGTFPTAPLAQADRLGAAWPVYRPTGLVRVTVGEKLLVQAARKLAVLYPPVRRCLRVFVQHPEHLDAVADALEELRHEPADDRGASYERFEVLVGFLPGRPASLLPLDGLLNEGLLTVETRFVADVSAVSEWLGERPVHLLVLAGQRHLHPLPVGREATHLHPLSLPQVLEYDQFDPANPLVLRPRGQQSTVEDEDRTLRPFAAFHTLAAEVAGQPGREWSGSRSKPAPDGTQPALLPLTVLLLLSAELPTTADPDHVLVLARQGGLSGDAVLTRWNQRYVTGVREAVLSGLNYATNTDATKLLRRLEATGHCNLLAAISAKGQNGFLPDALNGQLGLAVALRWYEDEATDHFHLTVSLNSALARRATALRPDLLGLRRRATDGGLSFDLLEVKAYEVVGDLEAPDQPGPQLRAAARALLPILTHTGGDLLTDCRRELLREQIFHEGNLSRPPSVPPAEWAAWVSQISTALDGQATPEINLLLVEVVKGAYFELKESFSPGNPAGETLAEQASIRRITLGEKNIQDYLKDRPTGGSPPNAGRTIPSAPPAPARPTNAAEPGAAVASPPSVVMSEAAPPPVPVAEPLAASVEFASQAASAAPAPPATAAHPVATPTPRPANLAQLAGDLYATLQDFNIRLASPIDPAQADAGPSLIRFKVELARGQSDKPVRSHASNIMRGLRLHYLPRIENLPGTQFLFVEVPRADAQPVPLLPVLAQEAA